MQRSFNKRSLLDNTFYNTQVGISEDNSVRNTNPNPVSNFKQNNKDNSNKLNNLNFCSLLDENDEKKETVIHETLNEVDNLVSEYHRINLRLKYIRGRLYSLGIDPEKVVKK